jgi:gas vesicle protein
MEDPRFYFWVGLVIGAVVGVAATLLYAKIRGLFASSEIGRLRKDNRALKQRIEKKDKYIQEMLQHTEKIAAGLAEQSSAKNTDGS